MSADQEKPSVPTLRTLAAKPLAAPKAAPRTITLRDLQQHNRREDAWIAVRGRVYDVTEFMDRHPGGELMLMEGVGKDATKLFDTYHHYLQPEAWLQNSYLGQFSYS